THLRLPLPDSDSAVIPVDHRRGDDDAVLTQRGSYRVRDGIDAAEHEPAARGVVPFALTYRLHVSHHAVECLVDGCHDTFFGRGIFGESRTVADRTARSHPDWRSSSYRSQCGLSASTRGMCTSNP